MTKQEAIALFGSVKELAEALNITREAIYQWPDPLTDKLRHQVIGAAFEGGLIK